MLGCVTFILHLVWESVHLSLYKGYEKLGTGWRLSLMATLGDVMYVLLAVLFMSLVKENVTWLSHPTFVNYGNLALLGFAIALFVEYKALALRRWGYGDRMLLVFGVGLSPLLQMTILLPLAVYIAHL